MGLLGTGTSCATVCGMTPTPADALGRAGRLFEIRDGDREAIVTEQGAGLFKARWAGADLLDTINDDGFSGGGGHGQLLLPWPGRVENGVYQFDGEHFQLPITDRTHNSAIHGFAHSLTWRVEEHRVNTVTLSCVLLAQPGYPFPLAFEQTYHLLGGALEISTTATNIGTRTAPFGFGAHPYFRTGGQIVNDSVLQVGAARYFLANDDLSPRPPAVPVDGTPFDFRQARAVGTTEYDVTLTDLERDGDGRAAVHFRSPDSSISITCTYEEPIRFLQIFSGDTLAAHRREGLAIEPCTCPPDSFNNGIGLIRLDPGGSVRVRWAITAE
jgi:aldose 1-epimerase